MGYQKIILALFFFSFCSTKEQADSNDISASRPQRDSVCKCIDTTIFDGHNFLPPFDRTAKIILYNFNGILSSGESTKSWNNLLNGYPVNTDKLYTIEFLNEFELTAENTK